MSATAAEPTDDQLEMWAKSAFLGATLGEIVDLNRAGEHQRLQKMKETMWPRFGYSEEHIRSMASQDYWDEEYARIEELDPLIQEVRGRLSAGG